MMKVTEHELTRRARRIVEADALCLAILVLEHGWTMGASLQLVRLAAAAAVNPIEAS